MIDPATFASQLVSAERRGLDYQFKLQNQLAQDKIKAYKAINTKASALTEALTALSDGSKLSATQATFSQDDFVKVTSSTGAADGEYTIEVNQLAQSHRVGLTFTDENWQAPSSGFLDLTLSGKSMSLDLSSLPAGATLKELRDAINNAADNPGISAIILQTGNDVKLVLTSDKSGAANTIAINLSGGAGGAYNALNTALVGKNELTSAQDALFKFSGVDITSASNNIENIIGNLNIELTKVNSGNATTLTIGRDDDVINTGMKSLVDGYNALVEQTKSATQTKDGNRAALSGDSTARNLNNLLRGVFSNLPSGVYLNDLGLSFDRSGKLSFDESGLKSALQADPAMLDTVLLGTGGLLKNLTNVIEPFNKSKGFFADRIETLNSKIERIGDKTEQLNMRMENTYQRYLAQFTQMNQLQAQMEQTLTLFKS